MSASDPCIAILAALTLTASSAVVSQAETRGVADAEIVVGARSDVSGPAATFETADAHAMQGIGVALQKAGKDLTTGKFLTALESIKNDRDIYGDPPRNYGPDKHRGSDETFVARVNGKFDLVFGPLKPSE
jgi:hypothetical protein